MPGRPEEAKDRKQYENKVEERFGRGEFSDVSGIAAGNVIMGCWVGNFVTAQDVLDAIDDPGTILE